MTKKTGSKKWNLVVLSVLVVALAVGVLVVNRVQDTRSSAAGYCDSPPAHGGNECIVGANPKTQPSAVCSSGKHCCSASGKTGSFGWCSGSAPAPKMCGGTRGSCNGSCPSGQVCRAPNPGNGNNCSCYSDGKKITPTPTLKIIRKPTLKPTPTKIIKKPIPTKVIKIKLPPKKR